ncbi:MAG: protein FdrA, partial [Acidobacteria bacterium]|nr:protein FdrA [Acidobacteriota bacterium]
GGTLAYEALLSLKGLLYPMKSNIPSLGVEPVDGTGRLTGHGILDLGADEFTVGRLHPMIDPDLRLRRLRQEAEDEEVDSILLDVVLGDGAHHDPAGALAPAIREAVARGVSVTALLVGTDEDPQDLNAQREVLVQAGATVFSDLPTALGSLFNRLVMLSSGPHPLPDTDPQAPTVALEALASPLAAINVGLELFHDSLRDQGASCLHVDWKPPAGGDERLLSVLARLKAASG